MTPDDPWLAAVWPFVLSQLPPAPATVLEVGCGPVGGFVPALLASGYYAVGIDPEARERPGYHRVEFERYEPPQLVDCVVASLSLHHVADLDEVLDRLGAGWWPVGCWWCWSGPGNGSTRPPLAGASAGWRRPTQGRGRAGCIRARSGGGLWPALR